MNSDLQPSPQSQLRLEQVSLKASVGAHWLLQDISFELFQADRLGIVGASGAGKTSLLRVLNRLNPITQGQIWFEGQAIETVPVIQLRQQIMLVPQESKLLGMTVKQALMYPLQLRGLNPQTIEHRVQAGLEQLHIPTDWLERTETQLSVGQRQLVAIARALITQPKVLLLDEPTSALDAGRGDNLLQVLRSLVEANQITVVLVTHQLDFMRQFCDRLLYLQQGRLLQDRSAAQINWQEMKQTLIEQQAETTSEWV